MNYLAHIFLSGTDQDVAAGNFMGDGVKGRITKTYPKAIEVGLHLHRFVDYTADTHPVNQDSRKFLYPAFGKYAGIVQDMLHDHFLALHWTSYSDQDIDTYLDSFYTAASKHKSIFPPNQWRFLELASEGRWLQNYATLDGMTRSLNGLSQRIKGENTLSEAGAFLEEHHTALEADFTRFFPVLQKACEAELVRLLTIL